MRNTCLLLLGKIKLFWGYLFVTLQKGAHIWLPHIRINRNAALRSAQRSAAQRSALRETGGLTSIAQDSLARRMINMNDKRHDMNENQSTPVNHEMNKYIYVYSFSCIYYSI